MQGYDHIMAQKVAWDNKEKYKHLSSTANTMTRRIGADGKQYLNDKEIEYLTRHFRQSVGFIERGEWVNAHLEKNNCSAAILPSFDTLLLSENVTISDILEELYHYTQYKQGKLDGDNI